MRSFKSFLLLATAPAAVGFAVFLFGGHQASAQQQQQQPVVDLPLTHATCVGLDLGAPMPPGVRCRGITRLRGDIYRVQVNRAHTHLYVTPEGIIMGDPMSTETALWLKGEIAQRFKVPVKYVVISQAQSDYLPGAQVFADTAEIWGNENAPAVFAANLKSSPERMKDAIMPQKMYKDRHTITLGGHRVELIHSPYPTHTTDNTMMYFPAEKVLVAADVILIRRAWQGGSFVSPIEGTPDDWIKFFKQVETIDFDIVSASHTQVGTKADVALFRNFLEDLMAGVTAGVKAGKTVEELEASDMLSKYRWLLLYEARRNASIEDAYRYVQKTKATATR